MKESSFKITKRFLLSIIAPALVAGTLVGCADRNLSGDVREEIVDGANRIILVRDATEETTPDNTALAFYVDARQFFENEGFILDQADEDTQIITTQPKAVGEDLMLRFDVAVQPAPGGSRMVAAAQYFDEAANEWREAAWTGGRAQDAFAEAFQILDGITRSDIGTAHESTAVTVVQ